MLDFSSLSHYDWLDVPMWVHDPAAQRNLWANAAALSFWRTETAEEFLSADFMSGDAAVRERLAATAEDHARGRIVREQWTLYPRGKPTTVMLVSRAIRTPDHRVVMLLAADSLASGTDKSMLRGVEALKHTSVRIGVFSLRDGSALMLNPAATLTFEMPQRDAKTASGPRDFDALFKDPGDAARVFAQVQAGASCHAELELMTVHGPCWHAVDARPMRDPVTGDRVMQLNARDIADLKASEAALEAARRAAEAASQAKSSFLANMSHEIRTPMNGVLGLTELVLQTELDTRQRRFIELAHSSAKALMVIINDLLDVAKIESGRVLIEEHAFSLQQMLHEALSPMLLQAHEKGITLQARVQPGVPEQLRGDALRLRQVLINLVGNALKFTETGEVRVDVTQVQSDPEGLRLRFCVKDTGIGMTPEQIAHIFEPFTQADGSITRRYGGTGLGLTIVQRLVRLMQGEVKVTSEPGQGSTFCFDIALKHEQPVSRPGELDEAAA